MVAACQESHRMNFQPIEILGFVGGTIGVTQALPQFFRLRRLGHGQGVSVAAWILMFAVASSWTGYGYRIGSPSQVATNIAGAVLNGLVVAALLRDKRTVVPSYVLLPLLGVTLAFLINVLPEPIVSVWLLSMTVSRVPQLKKSWQNRHRRQESAVSMRSLAVMTTSLLCWEVWCYVTQHWFVMITTTIALAMTLTIAAIEIYGKRTGQAAEERAHAVESLVS